MSSTLVQQLEARALHEAELQEPPFQLVHIHAMLAGMIGPHLDDDAAVARPDRRQPHAAREDLVRRRDAEDVWVRLDTI
jgi:hypothetical protein